jgi:predicted dithiol-disulfide oxidoreductase (DUF899 family)
VATSSAASRQLNSTGARWMKDGSWEQPGYSVFLQREDEVFHTYSMYARGAEWLGGSYAFLDLTPLGRQEDWEEPKGRAASVREGRPDFAS